MCNCCCCLYTFPSELFLDAELKKCVYNSLYKGSLETVNQKTHLKLHARSKLGQTLPYVLFKNEVKKKVVNELKQGPEG